MVILFTRDSWLLKVPNIQVIDGSIGTWSQPKIIDTDSHSSGMFQKTP